MAYETKQVEDSLVTAFKTIVTGAADGDRALLELSKAIIEKLNIVSTTIDVMSRHIDMLADRAADLNTRVDMLEQRHSALLQAFYSHCQEVASQNKETIN